MNKGKICRLTERYAALELSPVDYITETIGNMSKLSHLNAFTEDTANTQDKMLELADQSIQRYKNNKPISKIDGVPISFKSNYLVKGMHSNAGSKILSDFISPIDATLVERAKQAGAIVIGQTRMDEFGMGSFNFYSDKIPVNPIDKELVVGGSSGGAAVATATGQGLAAFATDTGGSITFPANWWSVYGFKPSYGRLSRYGVILYSSSNDTPGLMGQSIEDIEAVFSIVDGNWERDSNWLSFTETNAPKSIKDLKIGIANEFNISELPQKRIDEQLRIIEILQDHGAEIVNVSIPLLKQILPVYYTIIPAEAASNLSRYDGLKYGLQSNTIRSENENEKIDYEEYIRNIRTQGFGINVKRRIALGNFVLSTQDVDYNEMYIKAQKIRRLFCQQYDEALQKVDVLLSPNAVGDIPKIKSIIDGDIDPIIGEYSMDYFTVPSNMSGAPAIWWPMDISSSKSEPKAMFKLWGKYGQDQCLLSISKLIDSVVKSSK